MDTYNTARTVAFFSRHMVKVGVGFSRLSVIMLRTDGRGTRWGKKGCDIEMDICDHEFIKDMQQAHSMV